MLMRTHQAPNHKSVTVTDLIAQVQDHFDTNAHLIAGGENLSTLCLKEFNTTGKLVGFAYDHMKNRLFLGLAFGRLSEMLRFRKGDYYTLTKDERLKLEAVIGRGCSEYGQYVEGDKVNEDDLLYALSKSPVSTLASSLNEAILLGNDFMTGYVTSLLFIKAHNEGRVIA